MADTITKLRCPASITPGSIPLRSQGKCPGEPCKCYILILLNKSWAISTLCINTFFFWNRFSTVWVNNLWLLSSHACVFENQHSALGNLHFFKMHQNMETTKKTECEDIWFQLWKYTNTCTYFWSVMLQERLSSVQWDLQEHS